MESNITTYSEIIMDIVMDCSSDYENRLSMLVAGIIGKIESDANEENIKTAEYVANEFIKAAVTAPGDVKKQLIGLSDRLNEYIEAAKGGEEECK